MDEARDVAGISFPFTAGVAAGLWLTGEACHVPVSAGVVSVLSLTAAAVFTLAAATVRQRYLYAAAFLLTGIFCAVASVAGMTPGPERQGFAMRCAAKLKSVIDSIPFDSQSTGALVKALMTGDKSSLGRETIAIFRSSGASHILALSGLHLGIIYLITARCLSILGNTIPARRIRCCCVIIAAGFYTLMTTATEPAIDAAYISCQFSDRYTYDQWPDWIFDGVGEKFLDAEIAALIAPRPLFIEEGDGDDFFKTEPFLAECRRTEPFYKAAGGEDKLRYRVFKGGHQFAEDDDGVDFLMSNL